MPQASGRTTHLLSVIAIVFPLLVTRGSVGVVRADPGVSVPRGSLAANENWEHVTHAHGLPDDAITALDFGPDGTVWAGTLAGLARFDGQRWRTGPAAWAIGAPWITALEVDGAGRVWAGTWGKGLYQREGDSWRQSALPASDPITALAVDRGGRIWAGTFGAGIATFDGTTWASYTPRDGLAGPWVQALAVDQAGNVWAGTWSHGLSRFDGRSWHVFRVADGLPDNRVNALTVGSDGAIWVGTAAGLARFDGGRWRVYTTADGMPDDRVSALAASPNGPIWIGTPRGLARWDKAGFARIPLRIGPGQPYVSALAVDAAGLVWVGTLDDGLYRKHRLPAAQPPPARAPVVLIHGWRGPPSDDLASSQLKFLARWLRGDDYPVFYAKGITADQALAENARALRQTIEQARQVTGADRVHLIGHSMGGLVARAYVESTEYENDVASAIMLGTPNGGLGLWYGQVARWIRGGNAEPSLIELTPEFMAEFNGAHHPRDDVPYLLVAGDLTGGLDVLQGWPPNDGLIEQASVFAVPGVRATTDDAHGWTEATVLYAVPAYTWPRQTYERYIRPWLNDCHKAPAQCAAVERARSPRDLRHPQHTPFVTREIAAGTTMTVPLEIERAESARFFLTGEGGDLRFRLVGPNGRRFDGEQADGDETFAYLRLDDPEIVPFALYRVEQPTAGRWLLVTENRGSAVAEATTYAVLEDGQELAVSTRHWRWPTGEPIALRAEWTDDSGPVRYGLVVAEVPAEDGSYRSLNLADDGMHGDGEAGDGVYAAQFVVRESGRYVATVTARREDRAPRAQEVIIVIEEP